jgi:hypothetical protein
MLYIVGVLGKGANAKYYVRLFANVKIMFVAFIRQIDLFA